MLRSLFTWPGVNRRALSWVLPDSAPRRARVLDGRFLRPLRALGHSIVGDNEPAELVCARTAEKPAEREDLIALLRGYADGLPRGGVVILRSASGERERVAAAFLHAGLRDVEQARIGRNFLTAGVVAL